MKNMFRIAVIGVVVTGMAACNRGSNESNNAATAAAPAPAPSRSAVKVYFDGGFMFVQHADGRMSVVSPREEAEHHVATLKIVSPAIDTPYPLKDWDVALLGVEATTNTTLPARMPLGQRESDCEVIPKDTSAANNLGWLPDLSALHPNQRLDLSPNKIESRVSLAGGSLHVKMAFGCWQLKNTKGAQRAQSLVYGDNSVAYETATTQTSITLKFTPLTPAAGKEFTVPVAVTPGKDVVIEIGYPRIPGTGTPKNGTMADFSRHYRLLPAVDAGERFTPVAKIDHSLPGPGFFPGKECGSAFYLEAASAIAPR